MSLSILNGKDHLFPQPVNVVAFSDSHGVLSAPDPEQLTTGDLLIFAGDFELGSREDVQDFERFLRTQPHKRKLVTFGNMDTYAEEHLKEVTKILDGIAEVLVDRVVKVDGLRVFGSPYTPRFAGSFQFESEQAAEEHWRRVLPVNRRIDIIMTHGPPYGYGDTAKGQHVGDKALLEAVQKLRQPPKLWLCGHIHEARGIYHVPHPKGQILLINVAAQANPHFRPYVANLEGSWVREGVALRGPPQGRS